MNNEVTITIRDQLRRQLVGFGRWVGFEVFTKEETMAFLTEYLVATHAGDCTLLPVVPDFTDETKRVFDTTEAISDPGNVWHFKPGPGKASLLRCGALFSDGDVLCTDWRGNRRLLDDIINRPRRTSHVADILLAPWSHHLDGIRFSGYYDYVVLVAAKLCRLKESLPRELFEKAVVAYPLFGTSYELELLSLIGIEAGRVFDSRLINIRFETCVLGNSGQWFYPNLDDLMALKRQVEPQFFRADRSLNRVYISRAGRRRIVNEDALIALLQSYDIEIVEDKPRPVAEQIAIYQNASFIIGPHGASFTNIIWSQPGTHLVELFSPNYVPDFFLYMAQRLGLRYSAYFFGPESETRFVGSDEDIVVSIPDLKRRFDVLFSESITA